tara:strand:- start:422 stop:694 length:273 start_codon:yes stop_codon:yes gene_type:complete
MKIFIYKTIIVVISAYLLFQFTIGIVLKNYENKVNNLVNSKQNREEILNKIKSEIKTANKKDNLFTEEERELLSNFINKIRKELKLNNTE